MGAISVLLFVLTSQQPAAVPPRAARVEIAAIPADTPGITLPTVTKQVRPNYTKAAMKAHVQGTVLVQAVVGTDGLVTYTNVVKSLDAKKGLDREAVKAARQWEFTPGLKDGVPVPVMVTIELMFTLRK